MAEFKRSNFRARAAHFVSPPPPMLAVSDPAKVGFSSFLPFSSSASSSDALLSLRGQILIAVLFWTSIAAWDFTWAAWWSSFASSSAGLFLIPLFPSPSIENLKRFAYFWVVRPLLLLLCLHLFTPH